MAYQDTWEQVTSDPRWADLPDDQKRQKARNFARKVIQPQFGGKSQQMKDFLEQNVLTPVSDRPGSFAKGFQRGVVRGAEGNLTGSLLNAASRTLGNGDVIQEQGGDNSFQAGDLMGAAKEGLGQAAGAVVGTLADPLGLGVAKVAGMASSALPAVVPEVARRLGAGAAAGAVQSGGAAALQGGSTEETLKNAAAGALFGAVLSGKAKPKPIEHDPTVTTPAAGAPLPTEEAPPAYGSWNDVLARMYADKRKADLLQHIQDNPQLGAATPEALAPKAPPKEAPHVAEHLYDQFLKDQAKAKGAPAGPGEVVPFEPSPTKFPAIEDLLTDEAGNFDPARFRTLKEAAPEAAIQALRGLAKVGKLADLPGDFLAGLVDRAANSSLPDAVTSRVPGAEAGDSLPDLLIKGKNFLKNEAGNDLTVGQNAEGKPIQPLRKLREMTVSSFGTGQDYLAHKQAVESEARALVRPLGEKAAQLEQTLSPTEQEALHSAVTGEAAATPQSREVNAVVDPISRRLMDTGALTQEQYQAWQGKYLPRLYEKYLSAAPVLSQWSRTASNAIKGTLSRGKAREMSADAFDALKQNWQPVRDLGNGKTLVTDGATTREVPTRHLGDYVGKWQEMSRNGDQVTAWRDWTPDERAAMGEVKNVTAALRTLAARSFRDINNGTLLRDISRNPDWAVPKDAPEAAAREAEGWVLMSNERTKGRKVARWGLLADHLVRPDIARDLEQTMLVHESVLGETWRGAQGLWKKGKTVWSFRAHVNQMMQNMLTLEIAGGSAFDVPDALKVLKDKGPLFQQLEALGLYNDGFMAAEFAHHVMPTNTPIRTPMDVLRRLGTVVGKLDAGLQAAWSFEDDAAKTAFILGRLREGAPVAQAVQDARGAFYTGSDITSPMAQALSKSTHPFIKPFLYGIDKLPEIIARNPGKAAKLAAYFFAFQKISQAMRGSSDEEEKARQALLPDYLNDSGSTLTLPFRDSKNQTLILDTKNWSPINSVMDTSDRTAFPEVPQALLPSGLLSTLYGLASNYDFFHQKQLRSATGDETGKYLVSELLPNTVGDLTDKLPAAFQGRADYGGRRYDPATATANLFGIKAQPFDEEQAFQKLGGKFAGEMKDLQDAGHRLGKLLAQGTITQEQFDAQIRDLMAKFEAKAAEGTARLQAAEPALRRTQAKGKAAQGVRDVSALQQDLLDRSKGVAF